MAWASDWWPSDRFSEAADEAALRRDDVSGEAAMTPRLGTVLVLKEERPEMVGGRKKVMGSRWKKALHDDDFRRHRWVTVGLMQCIEANCNASVELDGSHARECS